jgi:hypothetical protein
VATSAPAASASTPASPLGAWRAYVWRRPSWWLGGAAALAWSALALVSFHPLVHQGHGDIAQMPFPAAVGWWVAMVIATMLPWTGGDTRWLAFRVLPDCRQQAIAVFALAFLAVWTAVGVAALVALEPWQGEPAAVAPALVVAAAWQVAPARRRVLRRCAVSRAPAIRGWRARADWARLGTVAGARCVTTCWAVMLPMAILHSPLLMLGAALVVASERRPAPNPERRGGRPGEALALLAGAAAFATLAAVG